jgi:hypothetical protein
MNQAPSAYSAKVDPGFANRIRAIIDGSIFLRLTGFHLAGKCSRGRPICLCRKSNIAGP